jgi:hypothetical protein
MSMGESRSSFLNGSPQADLTVITVVAALVGAGAWNWDHHEPETVAHRSPACPCPEMSSSLPGLERILVAGESSPNNLCLHPDHLPLLALMYSVVEGSYKSSKRLEG